MSTEKAALLTNEEYLQKAEQFMADAKKMDNAPLAYMIAAAFKNEDRIRALDVDRYLLKPQGETPEGDGVQVYVPDFESHGRPGMMKRVKDDPAWRYCQYVHWQDYARLAASLPPSEPVSPQPQAKELQFLRDLVETAEPVCSCNCVASQHIRDDNKTVCGGCNHCQGYEIVAYMFDIRELDEWPRPVSESPLPGRDCMCSCHKIEYLPCLACTDYHQHQPGASPVREQPILVCNKCGRRIEAGWSKEDGYFQVGARCYAPFAWSNCDGKLEPQRDAPVREQEGNKMAVLQAYPEARCVAAGWMSGTVHIILQTSDGVKYLSESFPKYHEGHDEECGCNPNWREQGEQEAWEQAAVLLRAKFPNSTVPAQTVREQGEWEKVERVTAEACFKAKGETRYWDYEVVDAEDYDRAVAYIRELERQREVKWNAWLKANQDLARLNTVLADALRIATESCMIFLFNPRPTVQAQVEHFMQQAESKLAASPQEKK